MDLTLSPERFAIVRHAGGTPVADALPPDGFACVVRSTDEVSVWMEERRAPAHGTVSRGWRMLVVDGPLDLSLTGVLAALLVPLADAGVPVFPFASYDTDRIGVPGDRVDDAVAALRAAGHRVDGT